MKPGDNVGWKWKIKINIKAIVKKQQREGIWTKPSPVLLCYQKLWILYVTIDIIIHTHRSNELDTN